MLTIGPPGGKVGTFAVLPTVPEDDPCLTTTVMGNVPSAMYMWLPAIVNMPLLSGPEIVPANGVPSPQLIVAEKALAEPKPFPLKSATTTLLSCWNCLPLTTN